jgi:hypothetical protein
MRVSCEKNGPSIRWRKSVTGDAEFDSEGNPKTSERVVVQSWPFIGGLSTFIRAVAMIIDDHGSAWLPNARSDNDDERHWRASRATRLLQLVFCRGILAQLGRIDSP